MLVVMGGGGGRPGSLEAVVALVDTLDGLWWA